MTNTTQTPNAESLTEEGKQMLEQMERCVSKIHGALQGELLTVAAASCMETAVSMVLHPSTTPHARMHFAQLMMDQAHVLSAVVSNEQADGPATIDAKAEPQIYLGN